MRDPKLCERCSYDEWSPNARVPDIWANLYLDLCEACADAGHKLQAQLEADCD